jgi:cystathionine beta-lyase/cystathionine gamma-synthase
MDTPSLGNAAPLVPPLYQSSVYTLPDLDALDSILDGAKPGFIYARDGHPNARFLAARLAEMEGAAWAVICGSGMAAISAILLATVQQGHRIVAGNRLYGRTVQLLDQELARYGIRTEFVDCNDLEAVARALDTETRVLFVETMSNPLLRIVDIPALAKLCRRTGARLVIDNTFATPVLTRPLEMGADIVMESLTKMIAGHSDVTLGAVCGTDPALLPQISAAVSIWGLAAGPFDCWLAERGLSTLNVRLRTAAANTALLAEWLTGQRGVKRVVYPALTDHPDHGLAGKMLRGACGNMLCFELEGGREAVNRFMRKARGIPFSPSLGDTSTTLSHPGTTSHRYVSAAEKKRQGIGDGLIRLSVGIEDLDVIQQEMDKGLREACSPAR